MTDFLFERGRWQLLKSNLSKETQPLIQLIQTFVHLVFHFFTFSINKKVKRRKTPENERWINHSHGPEVTNHAIHAETEIRRNVNAPQSLRHHCSL